MGGPKRRLGPAKWLVFLVAARSPWSFGGVIRAACVGHIPRCDMLLSDFLADKSNAHKEQGNPVVACNALYKAQENFNCYLTPA